ncbi:hypothetical protein BH23GEM3_BH23GEM3_10990 [soil metagenome]
MIVLELGPELWLFDQYSHSLLCGTLAQHWGAPPFAPVPHAVQRAAEIHDGGWREWDRSPRLDPKTGHPHPYSDMPSADYLDIWERGLDEAWAVGDVTGLLVSLHAMRFFGRKTLPEEQAFFAAQRAREAEALRRLGGPSDDPDALAEPFATWHAWMFFWDALSLFLCERWSSPWSVRIPAASEAGTEVRAERAEDAEPHTRLTEVYVDPYPFVGEIALEVPARVIPAARYRTQAELDEAIRHAELRTVQWNLVPPLHPARGRGPRT